MYELRPNLNRYNTLILVTPSLDTAWVPALSALRRQGVQVSAALIDAGSFGRPSADINIPMAALHRNEITTFSVSRGQELNLALSAPVVWQDQAGSQPPAAEPAGAVT